MAATDKDAFDLTVGGVKFDAGKIRMDLIPVDSELAIAAVFTYGAIKYEDWNWAKGMRVGRIIAALDRHKAAFMLGEELDPESGLPHTWHMGCCIHMLIASQLRGVAIDDRAEALAAYEAVKAQFAGMQNPTATPSAAWFGPAVDLPEPKPEPEHSSGGEGYFLDDIIDEFKPGDFLEVTEYDDGWARIVGRNPVGDIYEVQSVVRDAVTTKGSVRDPQGAEQGSWWVGHLTGAHGKVRYRRIPRRSLMMTASEWARRGLLKKGDVVALVSCPYAMGPGHKIGQQMAIECVWDNGMGVLTAEHGSWQEAVLRLAS